VQEREGGEGEAMEDEASELNAGATDFLTPTPIPHALHTPGPFLLSTPVASFEPDAGAPSLPNQPHFSPTLATPPPPPPLSPPPTSSTAAGAVASVAPSTPTASATPVTGPMGAVPPLYRLFTCSDPDTTYGTGGAERGGGGGSAQNKAPDNGNDIATAIFRSVGSPGSAGKSPYIGSWSAVSPDIGDSALAAVTAVADMLWQQCPAYHAATPQPHPPPPGIHTPCITGADSSRRRVALMGHASFALWSRVECVRIHLLLHVSGDRSWATKELVKLLPIQEPPLQGSSDEDVEGGEGVSGGEGGGKGRGGGGNVVLRGLLTLAHLLESNEEETSFVPEVEEGRVAGVPSERLLSAASCALRALRMTNTDAALLGMLEPIAARAASRQHAGQAGAGGEKGGGGAQLAGVRRVEEFLLAGRAQYEQALDMAQAALFQAVFHFPRNADALTCLADCLERRFLNILPPGVLGEDGGSETEEMVGGYGMEAVAGVGNASGQETENVVEEDGGRKKEARRGGEEEGRGKGVCENRLQPDVIMDMVLAIEGLYTRALGHNPWHTQALHGLALLRRVHLDDNPSAVGLLRRAVCGRFNPAVVTRDRRDATLLLHLANALFVASRDERPVPLNWNEGGDVTRSYILDGHLEADAQHASQGEGKSGNDNGAILAEAEAQISKFLPVVAL
jgi:hypothetical protein